MLHCGQASTACSQMGFAGQLPGPTQLQAHWKEIWVTALTNLPQVPAMNAHLSVNDETDMWII